MTVHSIQNKKLLFSQREKVIKPFRLCTESIHKKEGISLTNIYDTIQLNSPLWILKQPGGILDLKKSSQKEHLAHNLSRVTLPNTRKIP